MAAILRRPLVLADSRRPRIILAWDWSSLRKLKGSFESPKSNVLSVGTSGGSSDSKTGFDACACDAARFAAFALAICSRSADDVFLTDCEGGSRESEVVAVLADTTDEPDGPSPDVAEDPREAEEIFLGGSVLALLSNADTDGFLKRPLIEGRFVGLAASVLDPYLGTVISEPLLSGLGVLDCGMLLGAGDWNPRIVFRTGVFDVVLAACSDWMLCRDLNVALFGVLSIVERVFLYALMDDRKDEIPSLGPELEPGLLLLALARDGTRFDSSDWWLEPGREARLEGRELGLGRPGVS